MSEHAMENKNAPLSISASSLYHDLLRLSITIDEALQWMTVGVKWKRTQM